MSAAVSDLSSLTPAQIQRVQERTNHPSWPPERLDRYVAYLRDLNESLAPGFWLGARDIFIHYVPRPEDAHPEGGEVVFHTMVTATSFWGGPVGELVRWVCDGEFGYEARLTGADDVGGICDVTSLSYNNLGALAYVANELRQMWQGIVNDERGWEGYRRR